MGETVDVGTVLARLATDAKPGEAHASESEPPHERRRRGDGRHARAGDRATPPPSRRPRAGGADTRRYSPVVPRIAAEHGIDLAQVEGTGRGGRVRKQDVLAFVEDGGGTPKPEPPLHIESPVPAGPPSRGRPAPAPPRGTGRRRPRRRGSRCRACAGRSAST